MQCCSAWTGTLIPTGGDDGTSEYRLTEEDMERDLDTTVREDERDEKDRPLID